MSVSDLSPICLSGPIKALVLRKLGLPPQGRETLMDHVTVCLGRPSRQGKTSLFTLTRSTTSGSYGSTTQRSVSPGPVPARDLLLKRDVLSVKEVS